MQYWINQPDTQSAHQPSDRCLPINQSIMQRRRPPYSFNRLIDAVLDQSTGHPISQAAHQPSDRCLPINQSIMQRRRPPMLPRGHVQPDATRALSSGGASGERLRARVSTTLDFLLKNLTGVGRLHVIIQRLCGPWSVARDPWSMCTGSYFLQTSTRPWERTCRLCIAQL